MFTHTQIPNCLLSASIYDLSFSFSPSGNHTKDFYFEEWLPNFRDVNPTSFPGIHTQ